MSAGALFLLLLFPLAINLCPNKKKKVTPETTFPARIPFLEQQLRCTPEVTSSAEPFFPYSYHLYGRRDSSPLGVLLCGELCTESPYSLDTVAERPGAV